MHTPYVPISCSFHDRLEAIATTRARVWIRFITESGDEQCREAGIVDLISSQGAEYVVLSTGDAIRLDQLVSVDGAVPGHPAT